MIYNYREKKKKTINIVLLHEISFRIKKKRTLIANYINSTSKISKIHTFHKTIHRKRKKKSSMMKFPKKEFFVFCFLFLLQKFDEDGDCGGKKIRPWWDYVIYRQENPRVCFTLICEITFMFFFLVVHFVIYRGILDFSLPLTEQVNLFCVSTTRTRVVSQQKKKKSRRVTLFTFLFLLPCLVISCLTNLRGAELVCLFCVGGLHFYP